MGGIQGKTILVGEEGQRGRTIFPGNCRVKTSKGLEEPRQLKIREMTIVPLTSWA